MSIFVANTGFSKSWLYLVNRLNEIASALGSVVSVNSNTAVGNAAITGSFTSNTLQAAAIGSGSNSAIKLTSDLDLSGFQLTGNISITNAALYGPTTFSGNVTISNTLSVTRPSTFGANVVVNATLTAVGFSANSVTTAQGANLNGLVSVNGNTTLTGNAIFNGSVDATNSTFQVSTSSNTTSSNVAASTAFVQTVVNNASNSLLYTIRGTANANVSNFGASYSYIDSGFSYFSTATGSDPYFANTVNNALTLKVGVSSQSFDNAQQTQARTNINAMAANNVNVMTKISSYSGSNVNNVTLNLSSAIAAGYRYFILDIHKVIPSLDDKQIIMQVSTNGGASFLSSNIFRQIYISGPHTANNDVRSHAFTDTILYLTDYISNGVGNESSCDVRIRLGTDYTSVDYIGYVFRSGGYGDLCSTGAAKITDGSINALRILPTSGDLAQIDYTIWGVSV